MIEKSKIINVLNYNENPVCIKTHLKEYLCQPMESGNPSITPLEFSEVESLNSNSPIFKTGTLRFEEESQEEIYEHLRILDWQDILRNEDIEEILLHPSLERLTKIINITSVMLFERVRGIYYSLKNTNTYDLSTRVEKVIDARYKELCNRKTKTNILLSPKDTIVPISTEEVDKIKRQNMLLQEQMANMESMMKQMMSLQNELNKSDPVATIAASNEIKEQVADKATPKTQNKKSGRPKKQS